VADWFRQHPPGSSINGSPHSVCVSLPTMADVIAYEEKDAALLRRFQSGYPRFFRNPLIARLAHSLHASGELADPADPLLPNRAAAEDLCAFSGISDAAIRQLDASLWTVACNGDTEAHTFLRHTGHGLSSREAEAQLLRREAGEPFAETRASGSSQAHIDSIRSHLADVYEARWPDDIRLFRSGMNAFYSGFRALQAIQLDRGKDLWIQLGWLYVDTSRILERFCGKHSRPIRILNVLDLHELRECLREHSRRVAGIVTEIPTNPLVQTVDVQELRELADKAGAALVLDPTLVSPHNVNVLKYADLHVNSLTKYAAADADVMMGALALNASSPFYRELEATVDAFGSPPGDGDLARMAAQIPHYGQIIEAVNRNTMELADFLATHPSVASMHWAYSDRAGYNFRWLQHHACGPGAIISFTLKHEVARFYDRCRFAKSPSFGARFTMMCPFMYLAHYDMVRSADGRSQLRACGISPELIRLSVGTEPAAAIIEELQRSL
jgi:cystathionine gamma-synthase